MGYLVRMKEKYNDFATILEHQFRSQISRASMEGWWRFENTNHVIGSVGKLYNKFLLSLFMR